jgi:hypothetical protein
MDGSKRQPFTTTFHKYLETVNPSTICSKCLLQPPQLSIGPTWPLELLLQAQRPQACPHEPCQCPRLQADDTSHGRPFHRPRSQLVRPSVRPTVRTPDSATARSDPFQRRNYPCDDFGRLSIWQAVQMVRRTNCSCANSDAIQAVYSSSLTNVISRPPEEQSSCFRKIEGYWQCSLQTSGRIRATS